MKKLCYIFVLFSILSCDKDNTADSNSVFKAEIEL